MPENRNTKSLSEEEEDPTGQMTFLVSGGTLAVSPIRGGRGLLL